MISIPERSSSLAPLRHSLVTEPPDWFVNLVKQHTGLSGHYAAQLLWQRGIQTPEQIAGFLDPQLYHPASPFEFGQEMQWAVQRLQQARINQEVVAIWGDFDADGITATAVLWEGLGQFFTPHQQLCYYIPNRLTDSHGLARAGIERLAAQGCQLIVTCDTGSTNLAEVLYAQQLGLDVIITDHHTLPASRPPVVAIINPRYLAAEHPLAHLSGVAVAYKLVEALYETLPEVPQQPISQLLDLVAIGLIADLVQLSGDCRYLAQRGIEQLQQHRSENGPSTRPGVTRLLELCKKSGDRPTDISFGLGPRINAVSRIQGDAHFCVELLTSQDEQQCRQLAEATELANARRKSLQREVVQQVKEKLAQLDLSTTSVIVLADPQWPVGVLGLVAGQIAQEYNRPTILLTMEDWTAEFLGQAQIPDSERVIPIAKGSARSVNQIDLYQLVKDQEHLLHRFGGHPFAAGLSLPVENIPLFSEAINRQLRQQDWAISTTPSLSIEADLVVTVAELGKDLFRELKLLEPCGMGNPVPKLLIRNCWFERTWHRNLQDLQGNKVSYIKTEFEIRDDSTPVGFSGVWWGHYKEELPPGPCDAIVELDYNSYENPRKNQRPHYEVRLLAVYPASQELQLRRASDQIDWVLDWRGVQPEANLAEAGMAESQDNQPFPLLITQCPATWGELQAWFRRALQESQTLAIAYSAPNFAPPHTIWQQLIGIAKYLSRTGQSATRNQLQEKLGIGDRPLQLGFKILRHLGFSVTYNDHQFQFEWTPTPDHAALEAEVSEAIEQFLEAIREEQFRRQYFYQVPLSTLKAMAYQTALIHQRG